MEVIEENNIHNTLKELIAKKSQRDNQKFTIYQLARAINMPHSILVKLIHADPNKRVSNPRIDTLHKIVEFFRQDGFELTIDDLLLGFNKFNKINVLEQEIPIFTLSKSIPIYTMEMPQPRPLGFVDISLTRVSESIVAFLAEEDIRPMFKKGSVFVIEPNLKPKHGMLVAARIDGYNKLLIRKFMLQGHKQILISHDKTLEPIELMPTYNHYLLGVVIQVNVKT
ncbi:MAG: hypothetical protein Tsb005_06270 [Gammaproteobacteria bacterium]